MKKYTWHQEFYDKAMNTIVKTAGKKYSDCLDIFGQQSVGWLEYFEKNHPEQYKKYAEAMDKIINLWSKKDPESMETWKSAVKIEIEASQWAVDRYIEHQKKILFGQAQETLVTA